MPLLIALLTFASLILLISAAVYPVLARKAMKERLAGLMPPEDQRPMLVTPPAGWQLFLANLGRRLRLKQGELFRYRELLMAGGFRKENLYAFLGSKLLMAAALPTGYLFLAACSLTG